MKKIILLSLLYFSSSLYGMDETVNYDHFFYLCQAPGSFAYSLLPDVQIFIQEHPTIDINHKNEHGTTPVLHAATWGKWDIVWYLLDECNADKLTSDNYGQTLFSKAAYDFNGITMFKQLLHYYSLDELNLLCKTIRLDRKKQNPLELCDEKTVNKISAASVNKNNINAQNSSGWTTLHTAGLYKLIPLVIRLLENGANLDIKNTKNQPCYFFVKGVEQKSTPFIAREAFNNGPLIIPAPALMYHLFEKKFKENIVDAAYHVKQFYAQLLLSELFESPKARIWKYVVTDACALMGMAPTDLANEKRCLAKVMLLPQHQLTEINKQLLLTDK